MVILLKKDNNVIESSMVTVSIEMNAVYRSLVRNRRIFKVAIIGLTAGYLLKSKSAIIGHFEVPQIETVHALNIDDHKRFNFIADVVEISEPAVVGIDIKHKHHFDFITGGPLTMSNGSGFIIDPNGLILTNAHVVSHSNSKVVVKLKDGRTFDGIVEYVDFRMDLALIRIKAENLPTLKLGQSHSLRPGEFVIAMGSPLTLNNTVTFGVVSSINRGAQELGLSGKDMSYIQTDAAINFGNSGGPLINLNGEVIGVNSMKVTAGISFAIPIDYVKQFMDQVKSNSGKKPKSSKLRLGITMLTLTPDILREFQLRNDLSADVKYGVLIWKILLDSPAFICGLKPGDVIVAINTQKVYTANDVYDLLNSSDSSQGLTIRVYRQKNLIEINVKPEHFD